MTQSSDESVMLGEPVTGLEVEITVADPIQAGAGPEPPVSRPGECARPNATAQSVLASESVRPSNLTHVAYTSSDVETTIRFFLEIVGFDLSDRTAIVSFTRCGEVHHNLALQQALLEFSHHIAFEFDDVDDIPRTGAATVVNGFWFGVEHPIIHVVTDSAEGGLAMPNGSHLALSRRQSKEQYASKCRAKVTTCRTTERMRPDEQDPSLLRCLP